MGRFRIGYAIVMGGGSGATGRFRIGYDIVMGGGSGATPFYKCTDQTTS